MPEQSIAYVLMGYPRMSELFIASEIARMEEQGTNLRLLVLKPSDEDQHHPVVDRIKAQPVYLPGLHRVSPTVRSSRWLRDNLPESLAPIRSVAVRHPLRLARVTGWAAAQAWRERRGWRPRAVYAKEWMRATAVADELSRGEPVTHLHAHFAHRHHDCHMVGCAPARACRSRSPATPRTSTRPARTRRVCWPARCAPPSSSSPAPKPTAQHLRGDRPWTRPCT